MDAHLPQREDSGIKDLHDIWDFKTWRFFCATISRRPFQKPLRRWNRHSRIPRLLWEWEVWVGQGLGYFQRRMCYVVDERRVCFRDSSEMGHQKKCISRRNSKFSLLRHQRATRSLLHAPPLHHRLSWLPDNFTSSSLVNAGWGYPLSLTNSTWHWVKNQRGRGQRPTPEESESSWEAKIHVEKVNDRTGKWSIDNNNICTSLV